MLSKIRIRGSCTYRLLLLLEVSASCRATLYLTRPPSTNTHTHTHTPVRVEAGEVEEGFTSVNKQLRPLGLELCKARLEDREEVWSAVVNRNADPAAMIASIFTPQELEFFNKMVCVSISVVPSKPGLYFLYTCR